MAASEKQLKHLNHDHQVAAARKPRIQRGRPRGRPPKPVHILPDGAVDLSQVNPADYDKYKTLEAKYNQQLKELQLKRERGDLLSKTEVVELQQSVLQRVRAHALRLSTGIKTRLSSDPMTVALADAAMRAADEEVRAMLEGMANPDAD